MKRTMDARSGSAETAVPPTLLAHVRDALAAFEPEGGGEGGAPAAALVRATRETLAALREAVAADEAAPGDAAIAGRRRALRALVHRILEVAARRRVRLLLAESPLADEWIDRQIEAVVLSDYTVGELFLSRARALGDRTLFLLPPSRPEGRVSWAEAEAQVTRIARALIALRDRREIGPDAGPVALVGANSPEIALLDLACLAVGIPNVPVPASSPPDQISWILEHAGARVLLVGGEQHAEAASDAIVQRGSGFRVHWTGPGRAASGPVLPFEDFLAKGTTVPAERVREAVAAVRSGDLATTMYTSGTTGTPKGIPFTQANLVTKRFARAAAWPDLGEGDVFLCYLPLFHTFGRWLEMLGCVFWGSVYAFLEDVSIDALRYAFQRVRPTTFISVPKKWIQLAEAAEAETHAGAATGVVPTQADADREAARALVALTGGRLRRGLSAAGYLPPAVFRAFHDAGIELHSGFGMTEATGGITMTPAGEYRDDSIGVALPGIELKVADDGELLIRGPYVTPPAPEDPPRDDGWFATGDVVTADRHGHLRIVDRKKEIFKNVQGETISPRRVESLFADFPDVERAVLVGDGRAYCTVLLVPSAALREEWAGRAPAGDPPVIDSPEARERFAPLVSTVNRFLAPFERLLDFAVLGRDLDAERGELTAKGTPRRRVVVERFAAVIEPLYSHASVDVAPGGVRVRVPHWFLRQLGVPSTQVRVDGDAILMGTGGRRLPVRRSGDGAAVIVGDLAYDPGGPDVELGEILGRAELWLGNEAVRAFAGSGIEHWWRRGGPGDVRARLADRRPGSLEEELPPPEDAGPAGLDVPRLHALARALSSGSVDVRRAAVQAMRTALPSERPEIDALVVAVLRSGLADRPIRSRCLRALLPAVSADELDALVRERLGDPTFLDEDEARIAGQAALREDQLEGLGRRLREMARTERRAGSGLRRLMRFLGEQAVRHRDSHLRVRSLLATLRAETEDPTFAAEVETLEERMAERFRATLPATRLATGVTIENAVELRGEIDPGHRERILDAIEHTRILPESMALLGVGAPHQPVALRARTIRITFLGTGRGRTVYLLEWAPHGFDREGPPPFECVLKVNRDLPWEALLEERSLLVRARRGATGRPVVKAQGGAWREQGLWTEEFIPGQTLDTLVEGLLREGDDPDGGRLPDLWQFLVSSAAALVVDFWDRTGRTLTLARPSAAKVVLPGHDWQVGGRLVSIAERVPCERLSDVLESVHTGIVMPLRRRFPHARLEPSWRVAFSGALEVLGEPEGLAILEREAPWRRSPTGLGPAALRFVSSVRRRGFLPVRIRLAARRYRRWTSLNPEATLEAQAATLDQIASAYGLAELDVERPGSRLQLFRHTVFRGARPPLARAFDQHIARTLARTEEPRPDEDPGGSWQDDLAQLRDRFELDDREEFFLARILYPHVDPRGGAVLVRSERGGVGTPGVQVDWTDPLGTRWRIRTPRNPQEVEALSRVFRQAHFRRVPVEGVDELLVATDERGRVAAGVIFRRPSATYAHLEWIVVSRHRRGRGLGAALLREFLDRMRAEGIEVVSTGFFRPAFFRKFGFGVDPRYAGVVRTLRPSGEVADDPAPGSAPETDVR